MDYYEAMARARKEDANQRYERGVNAILRAIIARKDDSSASVLHHMRGLCGDDCRWCKIG